MTLFAGVSVAQTVTLTPGQMRQAATLYLQNGQVDAAVVLARALLDRDPHDDVAAIILADATSARGDHATALDIATRLYRGTESRDTKYIAARIAAREHAALEHGTRAQIWLRRARQAAPSAAAATDVAQDFAYIRARNPLQVQLRFGVSPTTNLNNGSSQSTQQILFFGVPFELYLSPDAEALSGLSLTAGIGLRYAVSGGPRATTFVTFDSSGGTYLLSDSAKAQAPGVRGRDFSSVSARLGLRHERATEDGGSLGFGLDFGRVWNNGQPNYDAFGLTAERRFAIGEGHDITANVRAERQLSRRDLPQRETLVFSVRDSRKRNNGDQFALSATLMRGVSDNAGYNYLGYAFGAEYQIAEPVLGGRIAVSADVGRRDYTKGPLDPVARADRFLALGADYTFVGVDFYGFSPIVSVTRQINRSNSGRYDTDALNFGFDLRTNF